MQELRTGQDLAPETRQFYAASIDILERANIRFLVGGAYAVELYTGVIRATKDFDVFVMKHDIDAALEAFRAEGYRAELSFPHWLGKAWHGEKFIDLIFSSGNGIAPVDETWFEHATRAIVYGKEVELAPPEESIWSKAYIMERERYDGADVAHLIHEQGMTLDWHRLVRRFGNHWRVLFAHLTLYGYIYPSRRNVIPSWVMRTLSDRMAAEVNDEPLEIEVCRGPVLSRAQYLQDLERDSFIDGRLFPWGMMTEQEIQEWTEAIEKEKAS